MCLSLRRFKLKPKFRFRTKMASPNRYFINPYQNLPTAQLNSNIDALKWKNRVIELSRHIQQNEAHFTKNVDGGLYVGPAGIAYAFYYLTVARGLTITEDEKKQFLESATKLVDANVIYYERLDVIRDKKNLVGFLTGAAGVYAVAAAIAFASKNESQIVYHCNRFSALAEHLTTVQVHRNGSDEMFVGRAGYINAAVWLKSIDPKLDTVPRDTLFKICDSIVTSGRQYSKSRRNNVQQPPPPLLYAYYKTEYLGAAHGLCAIIQMLLSVPGYLDQSSNDVVNDIKSSVDYLLSLQTPRGNFPCAMDEAPPYRERSEIDDLVHWCHGAPGVIYLFCKAYLIWKDSKYLNAALQCGECVWEKGLLTKGPGICHGVAGNGYVFLLLYRITNDKKHIGRAIAFSEFMYTDQFKKSARQPDCPFSLYEGLAGTMCFLADLLEPKKSAFPFLDVF
jgi:lantibiotic modifying enzyme